MVLVKVCVCFGMTRLMFPLDSIFFFFIEALIRDDAHDLSWVLFGVYANSDNETK